MYLTHKDLEELAQIILEKLQEEFEVKHLSGNLMNTIEVQNYDDKIEIIIPAQVYDMLLFKNKGVIVHKGNGSYASQIDEEGSEILVNGGEGENGFKKVKTGNHKGYVDRIIKEAVNDWVGRQGQYDYAKVTEQ